MRGGASHGVPPRRPWVLLLAVLASLAQGHWVCAARIDATRMFPVHVVTLLTHHHFAIGLFCPQHEKWEEGSLFGYAVRSSAQTQGREHSLRSTLLPTLSRCLCCHYFPCAVCHVVVHSGTIKTG